ncbi:DUF3151 family protein [Agromyces protaetiae]|uniref:DUF3151 family protein n=1 Tax=Agromyces protaetiae TaxID=2509455 RepID=UPI0013ED3AA0|nr:DUF3151 family protein [Agromyces protaetiae]
MTPDGTPAQNEVGLPAEPDVREALDASARDAVARVVGAHPGSPLAWAELADHADSEGRALDAFAYATVAADLAREQLAARGWEPGSSVPWADEPNRAYLRALDAQRRAAVALGLDDRATTVADELAAADPEAPARIASEFTPTQLITIVSPSDAFEPTYVSSEASASTEASVGDPIAAPDAAASNGDD